MHACRWSREKFRAQGAVTMIYYYRDDEEGPNTADVMAGLVLVIPVACN